MRRPALILALTGALAACTPASRPGPRAVVEVPPADQPWRAIAEAEDGAIIDGFAGVWTRATQGPLRVRNAIAAEGPLLDAGAGLDHPALPPGSYNCRAVRIERGRLTEFPPQFCFVRGESGGRLSFNKQTGSDLPNGWLVPDRGTRYIFLGAQQRRPGDNGMAYGTDRRSDRIGVAERIGPFRWRLAMPRDGGSSLWVYELTPVPVERQPE